MNKKFDTSILRTILRRLFHKLGFILNRLKFFNLSNLGIYPDINIYRETDMYINTYKQRHRQSINHYLQMAYNLRTSF